MPSQVPQRKTIIDRARRLLELAGRRPAGAGASGDVMAKRLSGVTWTPDGRVARVRLRSGDQIQVGGTAFTFQEKVKTAWPEVRLV